MRNFVLFVIFFSISLLAFADYDDTEEIEQRIRPVGQVTIEENAGNANVTQKVEAKPVAKTAPGQDIYEKYCVTCHQSGVAGAPKFRTDDWKPRLAKQNIDALTATAIKGLNAMPPKGTCADCTDADIKAAIQYMVPTS